jgi:hypothetical protein
MAMEKASRRRIVNELERTREGTTTRALEKLLGKRGGLKGGINHNESRKCSIPTFTSTETRTFSSSPKIAKNEMNGSTNP